MFIEVKDFAGYFVNEKGDIIGKSGKLLKPSINPNGYKFVILRKNNKSYSRTVHRIVATTFIKNPYNMPAINHKDEDKTNNKVENLEWCSYAYNNTYGTKIERCIKTRAINKTGWRRVMCIETNKVYDSIKDAALDLNIFPGDISRVCNGARGRTKCGGYHWKYV